MGKRTTLKTPFKIIVDAQGDVAIDPPMQTSTGGRCWFEYRNGRLCYCCQTSAGIQCYCANITFGSLSGGAGPIAGLLASKAFIILIVLLLLGVFLTWVGIEADPPKPWIVSWTTWIGGVIGIVAGARLLWIGGNALRAYRGRG